MDLIDKIKLGQIINRKEKCVKCHNVIHKCFKFDDCNCNYYYCIECLQYIDCCWCKKPILVRANNILIIVL